MEKLLMPFKSNSNDFAYGFQCGQIWERLNHGDHIQDLLIHSAIVDQVELICRRYHAEYKIEPSYEGWYILDAKIDTSKAN